LHGETKNVLDDLAGKKFDNAIAPRTSVEII
jgi:hypothetical protein